MITVTFMVSFTLKCNSSDFLCCQMIRVNLQYCQKFQMRIQSEYVIDGHANACAIKRVCLTSLVRQLHVIRASMLHIRKSRRILKIQARKNSPSCASSESQLLFVLFYHLARLHCDPLLKYKAIWFSEAVG